MESSSQRDATVLLRSTIRRQEQRHGAALILDNDISADRADWRISVLVDEAASKTGDLYIRSVCFSPDGKLLATGAEDKQIRVSTPRTSVLPRTSPDLVARSI